MEGGYGVEGRVEAGRDGRWVEGRVKGRAEGRVELEGGRKGRGWTGG